MKKRPKVIAIARRLLRKNKWVNWVSETYMSLLMSEDLYPVVVPITHETRQFLSEYAKEMAGLILVEGGDIHPRYYGGTSPFSELDEIDVLKDEFEFWLCRQALKQEIPILGLCRGLQVLNVIHGGTLFGDAQKEKGTNLKHMDLAHYDTYRHSIFILRGTPLHNWYDRANILVNSYHHQGIKRLAEPLAPMAYSPDGLIEAVYTPSHPFQVGLQFHPERMLPEYPGNRQVFVAFARAIKDGVKCLDTFNKVCVDNKGDTYSHRELGVSSKRPQQNIQFPK